MANSTWGSGYSMGTMYQGSNIGSAGFSHYSDPLSEQMWHKLTRIKDMAEYNGTVKKVLQELKNVTFFSGGEKERYIEIENLAKLWLSTALATGAIDSSYTHSLVKRINKDFLKSRYFSITPTWMFRAKGRNKFEQMADASRWSTSVVENLYEKNSVGLGEDAFTLVEEAIKEIYDHKEGLAHIELQVLMKGGMIVGFFGNDLVVYYNFPKDYVMDKLTDDGMEHDDSTRVESANKNIHKYLGNSRKPF